MKPSDVGRLLLLSAIWGGSFLFMRIIAPVLGAVPTAFFRVALATLGVAAILFAYRVQWNFRGKLRASMALGVLNSGLPFVMYAMAARLLPAGYSAIFNATTPLMGLLIGVLFFRERLTGQKALGVIAGLAGVVVLTRTGPLRFGTDVLIGAGACLIATSCYGLAGFLTRQWITDRGGLDNRLVAFGSQLGATIIILPFFVGTTVYNPPATWGTPGVWWALAALGLLCTAFAYTLYFRLIADLGPVKSFTVTFAIPPFGVLWGSLFLNEQLSWAHLVGGALIGLAIWMVVKQPSGSKRGPQTT